MTNQFESGENLKKIIIYDNEVHYNNGARIQLGDTVKIITGKGVKGYIGSVYSIASEYTVCVYVSSAGLIINVNAAALEKI